MNAFWVILVNKNGHLPDLFVKQVQGYLETSVDIPELVQQRNGVGMDRLNLKKKHKSELTGNSICPSFGMINDFKVNLSCNLQIFKLFTLE